jgi:hypothetical protein
MLLLRAWWEHSEGWREGGKDEEEEEDKIEWETSR